MSLEWKRRMNFRKHVLLGFLTNLLAFGVLIQAKVLSPYFAFNPPFALTLLVAIALFSILPDVDSSNSMASKLLKLFLALIIIFSSIQFISTGDVGILVKIVLVVLVFAGHFLYAKRGKMHRQFPHTLAFGAIACFILFLLTSSETIAGAGAVAFASHLAADRLSTAFKPNF